MDKPDDFTAARAELLSNLTALRRAVSATTTLKTVLVVKKLRKKVADDRQLTSTISGLPASGADGLQPGDAIAI